MQNFVQYAEAAMKRCKITSYNKLSKELGIANSSIVRMRSGKVLPAAKTMVKLARLAGVPEEKAILDLAAWANADKPEIQKIYERISKMIGCYAVIPLILFIIPHGITIATLAGILYYVALIFAIILIFRIFLEINKISNFKCLIFQSI